MPATPALIEPLDEHNETLLSNVHPAGWINPEPAEKYNLVVLGAGTAGLISAIGAAGLGAKVALIERHLMGGDCLNVGCVPSKGLIRAGRAAAAARRAGEFGVDVGTVAVDFPKVMERMRKLRAQISKNDSAKRFSEAGVDVFIGDGRFVSDGVVEVAGKKLNYAKAVIATGARAVDLPIPGLSDIGCLTNETLFSLTTLPKRLIVIGAGPIGVEMAQAFARFGSEVHLLESAGQILIREDQDAARIVEEALKKDGVRIISDGKIKKIFKRGTEKVVVLEGSDGSREIAADEILVGAGRAPNVEGMGLENVGVAFNTRTGVDVDDTLQTTHPDILAAGDVCFPYKFTHTADASARIRYGTGNLGRNGTEWDAPFAIGAWHQLAMHVHWSEDPEVGNVRLWFDGELVLDRMLKTKGPESVYFCQPGIHRSPHRPSVDTIYFDNFILADNLDEIEIVKPAE